MEKVSILGLSKHIIFAGARKDAEKCYSAMDTFCFPSVYEGVPVVVLEAQANGPECLCSDAVSEEVVADQYSQRLPLKKEYVNGLISCASYRVGTSCLGSVNRKW